jgi:hypothetical protein
MPRCFCYSAPKHKAADKAKRKKKRERESVCVEFSIFEPFDCYLGAIQSNYWLEPLKWLITGRPVCGGSSRHRQDRQIPGTTQLALLSAGCVSPLTRPSAQHLTSGRSHDGTLMRPQTTHHTYRPKGTTPITPIPVGLRSVVNEALSCLFSTRHYSRGYEESEDKVFSIRLTVFPKTSSYIQATVLSHLSTVILYHVGFISS